MNFRNFKLAGPGALVLLGIIGLAPAVINAQSNDSLSQRLDELDQKIRVLDRLREIAEEDAKAAAAKAPKVSAGEGGFGLSSADGAYSIKFRNFVQGQGIFFRSNVGTVSTTANPNVTTETPGINSFSIKRVQSDLTGGLGKQLDYRVHINFGGGAVDLLDVNLDWKILPEFSIRLGKFKPPTGLERLFSSYRAPFIEGSFVTALQPNRDIGVQAFGSISNGLVEYQAGVFDGARDGQNNTGDNNGPKDLYARVFAQPFLASGVDLLSGLGFGVSGSYGTPAPIVANLPTYGTGRQTIFTFNAADTVAGKLVRLSPQAYWYVGPFGLVAEYTQTTQTVRRGYTAATTPATTQTAEDELTNSAWALTGSWFVTGEKNAYKSVKVKKANTFPNLDGIGAIELLGRVHALTIDDQAFATFGPNFTQTYADPAKSVSKALGAGVATKWYLNSNVNIFLAYEYTQFTGGAGISARLAATTPAPAVTAAAASPRDREDEQVISGAFNVNF